MKPLRSFLDAQHRHFAKGGKLERFHAFYELIDTFLFTPGEVAKGNVHVRDALDLKRLMITVAIALTPCIFFAMYNTGLQAERALLSMGIMEIPGWRGDILSMIGFGMADPSNLIGNFIHGSLYFLPIYIVATVAGGIFEMIFAIVRGHEVNEGFLVTSILFPLTLPATIPLWQVAVGIIFGVVIGKEVFGGTGKNFLNPALTGRAFLFFAYPAEISGDRVWVAADGYAGATALGEGALGGMAAIEKHFSWWEAFIGTIPGSLGETSAIACLIGAVILCSMGIGSWRIMLSMFIATTISAYLLYTIGSETNPMFSVPAHWHWVIGGFAFGMVFMATDPVSASMTQTGQWFYGSLIGVMVILVRVINPAFPEGVMLAILFGNVFAPVIDNFVAESVMKRRQMRVKEFSRG